jgi:hypothetical protein
MEDKLQKPHVRNLSILPKCPKGFSAAYDIHSRFSSLVSTDMYEASQRHCSFREGSSAPVTESFQWHAEFPESLPSLMA